MKGPKPQTSSLLGKMSRMSPPSKPARTHKATRNHSLRKNAGKVISRAAATPAKRPPSKPKRREPSRARSAKAYPTNTRVKTPRVKGAPRNNTSFNFWVRGRSAWKRRRLNKPERTSKAASEPVTPTFKRRMKMKSFEPSKRPSVSETGDKASESGALCKVAALLVEARQCFYNEGFGLCAKECTRREN